ncbi:TPA: hypothetical protein DIU27_00500 [Candidatus Collierbacteria bacterium]|uniref:O-antigen flippase n=1 Tax=Candidatus Collierbacteria bacterium GW2011_GWB2_44_22 TaxID=1618387 RepID=A0A0G1K5P5_9BACT|nr:MAG: O-antigen flippase [Candidatus Collierbacteria bacterium GW2011_GWA2_44_13]KKT49054.1 MAG: O-antigen flippase [Candidatus Collierbacteria bacterium GW2011_GWB1_44_197]KKT51602.1 MAG: O-antigen flippase [Candidatus Collierbacteria bacterium GW2011_GWB2_44_22]KKT63053.1 MAG: O-antigen flippase [Candidatus Collierbacteria bacterium GW2011_GWD1_44_27]KKT66432.1 MAG: O-antigen flippase [Candidatus Collierbacteria bacterium GW2011_GWC2_44_30]KKT68707.1 MAG: O-antigen flippase [Microgenomates
MSIKTSLIKNTGINLAGYFYLLIASFFSVSILLNNLGRDIFGVYIFLLSFVSLSAVFDFGISNAVVRKLSLPGTERIEKVKTWKTSFAIFIALAFILFVCVIVLLRYLSQIMPIFAYLDRNTINLSILMLATIAFVNHVNIHLLSLPQAEQRFDIFNSKTLLVGTANTVISAAVSGFYPNIAVLYSTQLIFHLFTLIFMINYSLKLFSGSDFSPSYDKSTGRELFSFGLRNFVGTLAGQVENQFSNFILGAMVSARAITAFSIPQSIVAKGAGVISQFAQAFFPLSASLLEKDRIKKLKTLVLGVEAVTLIGGVSAVILSYTIGQPFLLWWLKDPIVVQTAFPVLKILSFYFLLVSLTPVPTALLQGLNKPQIPSFFGILTVSVEIILSLFFVPLFGAIGVAYSFLLSVCLTVPLILIVTWVQLDREIKKLALPLQ